MIDTSLQGINYLTALIRASADPGGAEPELPPGRPIKHGQHPMEMAQLRRQMAEKLADSIRSKFMGLLHQKFTLSNGQAETLRGLPIAQDALNAVIALNYLEMIPDNYAINARLVVIKSIPNTSEGNPPGWKEWWLHNADEHIGVYRPQDHDPQRDPVSEILNTIIAAIAQSALHDMPNAAGIARHLIHQREAGRSKRTGRQDIGASEVWAQILRIRYLAQRIGIQKQKARPPVPESPETLIQELRSQGVETQTDMGTIGSPEKIREDLAGSTTQDINASVTGARWYLNSAHMGYMIDTRYVEGSFRNQINDPQEVLSKEEMILIQYTVPQHPGINGMLTNTPNEAAAIIGFLNRITPLAVEEYIDEGAKIPDRSNPPPCPQAARCLTWCGTLQSSGQFPFSLTHDGKYESCRYREFLERFGDMEPTRRGAYALDPAVQEQKNSRSKIHLAQDLKDNAQREEAATEAPGKTEKTVDRPRQASLF